MTWQNIRWHEASRGLSATAEFLSVVSGHSTSRVAEGYAQHCCSLLQRGRFWWHEASRGYSATSEFSSVASGRSTYRVVEGYAPTHCCSLLQRGRFCSTAGSVSKIGKSIYTLCLKKMSQVWLAMALTHIYQFLQFLAHVISRGAKIGCRYNFLKYLAFTYFIMLWCEMT